MKLASVASIIYFGAMVSRCHHFPLEGTDWFVEQPSGVVIHCKTGRTVLCAVCRCETVKETNMLRRFTRLNGSAGKFRCDQPLCACTRVEQPSAFFRMLSCPLPPKPRRPRVCIICGGVGPYTCLGCAVSLVSRTQECISFSSGFMFANVIAY